MGISAALGSSALLPAGLGFRNAIINGDFRINQRGGSSQASGGQWLYDRWRNSSAGAGTTTLQTQTFDYSASPAADRVPITNNPGTNFLRVVTASHAEPSSFGSIQQPIEGVRTFAGQQVTVSFWAKAASGTPRVSLEMQQIFGTGGSPSSAVLNNGGQVTLSTSWARYQLTMLIPSIVGKTIGTNNDDSLTFTLFVSANSGLNARTGTLGLQNNTFDFWGIQVEQNSQATPFEQRPIGTELALCQRYYEKSTGYYVISGMYGSSAYINVFYKVRKRVAPSVTGLSGGSFDGTSLDNFGVGQAGNAWVLTSWEASAEL